MRVLGIIAKSVRFYLYSITAAGRQGLRHAIILVSRLKERIL